VKLMEHTSAPVINPPSAVLRTARAAIWRRLGEIPGVVTPVIANQSRDVLSSTDAFPLWLRGCGSTCLRVETADGLAAALSELPGEEFTAIRYPVDVRRKYRVMTIGGSLYPLHLTADMTEDQHRAEETKFLRDMPGVLGPRAMAALAEIQKALSLDYAGIDFGLSPSGEVLLFEANASITVAPPGGDRRWDDRRAAIQRVEDAVRKMLMPVRLAIY
jgi:hypothetical protein